MVCDLCCWVFHFVSNAWDVCFFSILLLMFMVASSVQCLPAAFFSPSRRCFVLKIDWKTVLYRVILELNGSLLHFFYVMLNYCTTWDVILFLFQKYLFRQIPIMQVQPTFIAFEFIIINLSVGKLQNSNIESIPYTWNAQSRKIFQKLATKLNYLDPRCKHQQIGICISRYMGT